MNKSPKTWGDVLLAASEKELTGGAVLTRESWFSWNDGVVERHAG